MITKANSFYAIRKEYPEAFNEMLDMMGEYTHVEIAQVIAPKIGNHPFELQKKLKSWSMKYKLYEPVSRARLKINQISKMQKREGTDKNLTDDEIIFLEKFKNGEVDFEEAQRQFAYRVLKKIMTHPELLKASDWLRSEVVKIKREELSVKKENLERAWQALFSGFMPPTKCPHCGGSLKPKVAVPLTVAKGELVTENGEIIESLGTLSGV